MVKLPSNYYLNYTTKKDFRPAIWLCNQQKSDNRKKY